MVDIPFDAACPLFVRRAQVEPAASPESALEASAKLVNL
jgi:hypothetical protein